MKSCSPEGDKDATELIFMKSSVELIPSAEERVRGETKDGGFLSPQPNPHQRHLNIKQTVAMVTFASGRVPWAGWVSRSAQLSSAG